MAWTNTNPTESIVETEDSYYQPLSMRYIPTGFINGNATGFTVEDAKLRVLEKVTTMAGITLAAAEAIGGDLVEQTLTSGGYLFAHHEVRVSRRRANPCGGYNVVKTETWRALYVNGSWTAGAAASNFI